MRPQNGPVAGQIVKVIHDDGYEQVDDLKAAQAALRMLHSLGSYTGTRRLRPVQLKVKLTRKAQSM